LEIGLGIQQQPDDWVADTEKLKTALDMTEGALCIVLEGEQNQ